MSRQADWIRQFPEIRFKVYGHTDLVGSDAYNRNLGLRRAQAAVAYLVSQGVSRSRLEATVSLGETQPIVATQEMERRNRVKADLLYNESCPDIEVDPETYTVKADGEVLTCEPLAEVPLAQRYFLF